MKIKNLFVHLALVILFNGCSSVPVTEPPAKVAAKAAPKKPLPKNPAVVSPPRTGNQSSKPGSATATYPIDTSTGNFKDETSLPTFRAEPLMAPVESSVQPQNAAPNSATAIVPGSVDSQNSKLAANAAMPTPIVTEEAGIPSGTSPAVVALLTEADKYSKRGDLNSAAVDMERALQIDSRNPTITYKIAQLRLKQSKYQQAEELAKKAASLAGGDLDLKRKSWLLISEARHLQHNNEGAKEARIKASSFFGH